VLGHKILKRLARRVGRLQSVLKATCILQVGHVSQVRFLMSKCANVRITFLASLVGTHLCPEQQRVVDLLDHVGCVFRQIVLY
jgi:hypothetical protein